jgi:hypothetical protein
LRGAESGDGHVHERGSSGSSPVSLIAMGVVERDLRPCVLEALDGSRGHERLPEGVVTARDPRELGLMSVPVSIAVPRPSATSASVPPGDLIRRARAAP